MRKLLKRVESFIVRYPILERLAKFARKFGDLFQKPLNQRQIIQKASQNGKMTGFEPWKLKKYQLRQHELMFGEPGLGLSSSGFSQSSIHLGQEGELNFAKALQKVGYLDRFLTFWSIHNLGLNDEKLDADVDCIIVSKDTIWLIDLKLYASGDVVWQTEEDLLYTIDRQTGCQVGKPKRLSKNMFYAEKVFKRKFSRLLKYFKIESRVVFMPTTKGMGEVKQVFWPGGIQAVTLDRILEELRQQEAFQDSIGGQMIKQTFNVIRKRK